MPRRRNQEPERPTTPPGGWRYLDAEDPEAWPQLVAFDLDYTLWDCWIDTHITPPVKRTGEAINQLVDRRGMPLEFYAEVPGILSELKRRKIHIAAASRTSTPELAREALGLLLLHDHNDKGATETVKAISYFNTMEIYPGSKLTHFQRIHKKTGIPYDQMLFFDDEHRNYETESLGVTMQLVPPKGTDRRLFKEGLALWRARRGIKVVEE